MYFRSLVCSIMTKRRKYQIAMIVCVIYLFIPEPTDAFPPLGWLDEATVLGFAIHFYRKQKGLKKDETEK